ncbi:hypothetical protein NKH57_17920 [Mesorhizobium sp. M1050]|uniref:hypothetical protein n=1 Tax=unclassified Mesorhizobium TaxID=325217 RepID=UPI0033359C4E
MCEAGFEAAVSKGTGGVPEVDRDGQGVSGAGHRDMKGGNAPIADTSPVRSNWSAGTLEAYSFFKYDLGEAYE